MNNIFTICYSEEEANEIGHFILSRGVPCKFTHLIFM